MKMMKYMSERSRGVLSAGKNTRGTQFAHKGFVKLPKSQNLIYIYIPHATNHNNMSLVSLPLLRPPETCSAQGVDNLPCGTIRPDRVLPELGDR